MIFAPGAAHLFSSITRFAGCIARITSGLSGISVGNLLNGYLVSLVCFIIWVSSSLLIWPKRIRNPEPAQYAALMHVFSAWITAESA